MGTHATFQAGPPRQGDVPHRGRQGHQPPDRTHLCQAGAAVTIEGRTADKGRGAAAEIEASVGRAIGLSADVPHYAALRSAVEQSHTVLRTIDPTSTAS
jgi:hypothetical protein